jgi:acetyl esterase/lipase
MVGFVLRYRLLREDADGNSIGYTRDDALADAAAAMTYIRQHAGEYGVDPGKVGAMGFSAGGDLCLRAGLSDDPLVKPDFLCPVCKLPHMQPAATGRYL